MDANSVTLIVGLAGIIATLITAVIGFYYTAKSRSSPYREQLYLKQLELIVMLFHLHGRFKTFATLIIEKHFLEEALTDIAIVIKDHSVSKEQAAAIFPVELFRTLNIVHALMMEFIGKCDEGHVLTKEDFIKFSSADLKFALQSRTIMGVDELTKGSTQLVSSSKNVRTMNDLDTEYFHEFVKSRINGE
ncbi:hypothetical protein [Chitinophaga sp. CF418]|uniref:hypothetical protein n=1 Tax=Chitinophaga sp. CF418 TaxID=1855287 RepID=UPI00091A695E|nr:hypothetical protein [Chitinophaga sp. CF418]SHN45411.1 hypothetical protein SAMN05216311_12039 [Chitinophaga sp. CF418]